MNFEDIIYEKYNGRAKITINRPEKLNAFTNHTLKEMIEAMMVPGLISPWGLSS